MINNSDDVFKLIEQIAVRPEKLNKEALIASGRGSELFCDVLERALNPFRTYGMAKRPKPAVNGDGQFNDNTRDILDKLASRELSGAQAKAVVIAEMSRLTPQSEELFWRIISKDLRAGFSSSTVNKVMPGLVASFDCMLAHPLDAKRIKKWPQVAEPKLDGVRVLAFVNTNEETVHFCSRSGKEFTTFEHLKEPILKVAHSRRKELGMGNEEADRFLDFVLDGEIVSGSFNKTVSEVRRKDAQATDAEFHVFDILDGDIFKREDKKGEGETYEDRREALMAFFRHVANKFPQLKLIPRYLVSSMEEIDLLYKNVQARGLEGLIIKDPDGLYHRRRNHAWMKIKAEESVDVRIVDVEEGTNKYEGQLGAMVVDHNGVRVNVGSGLSDSQRASFWEAKDELIGRLIEVEYHEITPDGSLRHPRFKRFRDDKEISHD